MSDQALVLSISALGQICVSKFSKLTNFSLSFLRGGEGRNLCLQDRIANVQEISSIEEVSIHKILSFRKTLSFW